MQLAINMVENKLTMDPVLQVLVVFLAIYLHYGNCRTAALTKIMGRIQNGAVPSTQGAAAWRQKRSPGDEPSCYTGTHASLTLPSNNTVSAPICKTVTSYKTACFSSMANNNNQRKCVPSHMITIEGVAFNTACSCAPQSTQSQKLNSTVCLEHKDYSYINQQLSLRAVALFIIVSCMCFLFTCMYL